MRNGKFAVNVTGLKYKIAEGFKNNKKTCFFIFIVALIGVLTGVFTAINYCNGATLINFNDFSLCKYLAGELGSLELFFSRFLSYTTILLIVAFSSISVFILPVLPGLSTRPPDILSQRRLRDGTKTERTGSQF